MSKQPDSVLHVLMFIFKKYANIDPKQQQELNELSELVGLKELN